MRSPASPPWTSTAGGVSTATVTSEGPLDPAAARAAVEEAGYTLVEA